MRTDTTQFRWDIQSRLRLMMMLTHVLRLCPRHSRENDALELAFSRIESAQTDGPTVQPCSVNETSCLPGSNRTTNLPTSQGNLPFQILTPLFPSIEHLLHASPHHPPSKPQTTKHHPSYAILKFHPLRTINLCSPNGPYALSSPLSLSSHNASNINLTFVTPPVRLNALSCTPPVRPELRSR